jgi:hypothetical protein
VGRVTGQRRCTGNITYTPTEPDERRIVYPTLLQAGVRVLVFNGSVARGRGAWVGVALAPLSSCPLACIHASRREADACVPYHDK